MANTSNANPKVDFWTARSKLGDISGSNDFMLKKLETDFILSKISKNCRRVLDLGCGNGDTLIEAHKLYGCEGVGIDFSPGMVELANKNAQKYFKSLRFQQADIRNLPEDLGSFDVIYTQRCLINLDSPQEQKRAFDKILSLLNPGGIYIMVENTVEGHEKTNNLRRSLNIAELEIPWHNIYMNSKDIESWATPTINLEYFEHISSTYHFMSRVVYAYLGEPGGGELKYDSEINKLSLLLPGNIGDFGPVKGWVWRKKT